MSALRVSCVYPDGTLTAEWFQIVRRLREQAERGGLDVSVRLGPLAAVATEPRADVVVAPAALADAVRSRLPSARVVAVPAGRSEAVLSELLRKIAESRRAPASPRSRHVVRRGFEVLPWTER